MQAIKAGWAVQTFALARCGDTQGKRIRIRKSKEERKKLAETFVKTYRKSNDGNFPSLNLIQKEVGGSFYTVREVVREIIQENRILGSGNSACKVFTLEESGDQTSTENLSLDEANNLSLAINEKVDEDGQTEGPYIHSEDDSSSKGISTLNDVLIVNNMTDSTKSVETVVSLTNGSVASWHLNDLATMVPGEESCVSRDNSLFHMSQDVAKETFLDSHSLQSENEPHEPMSANGCTDNLHGSGYSEAKYHDGVSQGTSATSSSDVIFPNTSETNPTVKKSKELLNDARGVFDSVIQNPSSDDSIAVEVNIPMDAVNLRDIPESDSAAPESITVPDTSAIYGVMAKGISDASAKSDEYLSSLYAREGSGKELRGEDYAISNEEAQLVASPEKDARILSVDPVQIEEKSVKSRDSNLSIKPPATSISETSTSKVSETEVVSILSNNLDREGTTMNKTAEAGSETKTHIGTVMRSAEVTEKNLPSDSFGIKRQSTGVSNKQSQASQPEPIWNTLKKLVAAFIKFWTE